MAVVALPTRGVEASRAYFSIGLALAYAACVKLQEWRIKGLASAILVPRNPVA